MDTLTAAGLRGWTPVRVWGTGPAATVEWAMVDGDFVDPFFEQTAERTMRTPFNAIFARRTPLALLDEPETSRPVPRPSGLVFHLSRSGSTLVGQMLAELDAAAVVSEAQPIDAVLAPERRADGDEVTVRRLRGLAGAFARPGRGERRLFLKLHARHILDVGLFARAFPEVPWIFAFREPREVLRSQAALPGAEVVAGELVTLDPAEHAACTLAAFARAAIAAAGLGRAAFVDYASLPAGVTDRILPHFGIVPTTAERGRMRIASERDTKRQGSPYRLRPAAPDGPDEELDALAARWLDGPYAELRSLAAR